LEFLVSGNEFFFLEMNTRIQVEHTVSEMVSGLDFVREQLRVARGEKLGYTQQDVELRGHSIEVRVNAEDPARGFAPAPGTITAYREPGGPGVRVDSAAFPGMTITPDYDSLVAKLVVWAPTRERAVARLRRALDEFRIDGVATTLPLLRALSDEPSVRDSTYGTATLEPFAAAGDWATGASASVQERSPDEDVVRVEVNGKLFRVRMLDRPRPTAAVRRPPPRPQARRAGAGLDANAIVAPMHGVVVEVGVTPGQAVQTGTLVAVIEAMKMMNEIRAPRAGTIGSVKVAVGQTVETGGEIATFA
jgi:acetyl-CoA/propionyl-CoA carboxylase biotin carboxyl carrier protein